MDQDISSIGELLERLEEAASNEDQISIQKIIEVVGARSFGPLLLIAGLIALAPVIGDIPGVPTTLGIFILLLAVQMMFRDGKIWLPQWLLKRSVSRDKFLKGTGWLHKPAKYLDRLFRPRFKAVFQSGKYFILLSCAIIAALMPLMEIVPFSANIAGFAFTVLGLSLITHDGLLASLALTITGIGLALLVYNVI